MAYNDSNSIYSDPIAPSPNKTIACQDLLQQGSYVHSGWLRRQSLRNRLKIFSWPQVYVVIAGGCVYCFGNETAKRPATVFSLYGYDKVFRSGEITMKEATWAFKLVHANPDYRSYQFSASSEKEMAAWMKLFKREMLRANGKLSRTQGDGKSSEAAALYQDAGSESSGSLTSQDYMEIEANIYEDSTQFVLPQNYTNKKEEEDSDDEMNAVVSTRPDPLDRPPLPPPVPQRPPAKKQKPLQQGNALIEELKNVAIRGNPNYTASPHRTGVRREPDYTDSPSNAPMKPDIAEQPSVDRSSKPQAQNMRTRGSPDGSSIKKDDQVPESNDFWSSIFFYGDKDRAADIIRNIPEEGVFLLRVNPDKSMVLHVFANGFGRKFQIFVMDDKKFTLKKDSGHYFNQVEELIYFYYDNPLPGQKPDVYLTECYAQHELYRKLNLT